MNYFRDPSGRVYTADSAPAVNNLERVVVISPEDREQVEELERDLADRLGWHVTTLNDARLVALQAALRSLIAPPKPEEPQGLGAVVEDADGVRFVRRDDRGLWVRADQFGFRAWDDINAVRILSGGVA